MQEASTEADARAPDALAQLYFDGFEHDVAGAQAIGWKPSTGSWAACQPPGLSMKYCQFGTNGMSVPTIAGQSAWSNYTVAASTYWSSVMSKQARVMLLGRVVDDYHFYDLEVRSDPAGSATLYWYIGRQNGSVWTKIAGGPLAAQSSNYLGLRLSLTGGALSAYVSYDYSPTYVTLGSGTDSSYATGGIGLQSLNTTSAKFDSVRVTASGPVPTPLPTTSPTASPIAPSGKATPTPPPSATLIYQIGDTVAYPSSGDGQYTNPAMFVNQWGGNGYHFHMNRTDTASPCSAGPACPYRQMVNVGAGPTELNWGHHYQIQWQQVSNLLENGSFGRTLIAQIHPYGNANEITNLSVDSVDCGTTKFAFQDQSSYTDGSPTCYSNYAHGATDDFLWDFTLPNCPSDSGGYDRLYLNGNLMVSRNGPVSQCDKTVGPWIGFGIYEYRWAEGGGATDMSEDLPINYLKIWSF
jgi:hypothetical protein